VQGYVKVTLRPSPPAPLPHGAYLYAHLYLPHCHAVYRLPRRATDVAAGEPTAGRRPAPTPESPAQAGDQP